MRQFKVSGMSCASCSARVEKAVKKLPGVTLCSVSLLTEIMNVEGNVTDSQVIQAVVDAGYGATLKNRNKAKDKNSNSDSDDYVKKEISNMRSRLVFSLFFLVVLMYFSMGHTMFSFALPSFFEENPIAIGLVQLILCVVVMVINQRFFINGFRALVHLSPNMDTLVALGSASSFVYSVYALFAMIAKPQMAHMLLHNLYFESAAMILALITVGKLLEAYSKGKTTNALKALMKLSPKTVIVIKDGKEQTVFVEELSKDDIFIVRPGESFAADGIVVKGNGSVNEASLTGESIPVDKKEGDKVSASTINLSGVLLCRATRVGEDTTISQIIRMVSEAAISKAPVAKIADKVSGVFVPIVMGIAAVTVVLWLIAGEGIGFALARGVSVLVISCPCALGLATPVAIMVGNGVGAKNGILFKTAESLEKMGKVNVVALDKTGTITSGKPTVTDFIPLSDKSEQELLEIAYSLEYNSKHPLAQAVAGYAKQRGAERVEVSDFEELAGCGVRARSLSEELYCGSVSFISTIIEPDSVVKEKAAELADSGKTPLLFAKDKTLMGIIAVADTIKPDSAEAIAQLKEMGAHVVMLTGDNQRTAKAIAEQVGVDQVFSGVLPEEKANIVSLLQKKGKVAMVGDGINDAPALTYADVGVAIGAGTDVAIDAAEVVLVNNRLSDVAAAMRLSKASLRTIHQNLFWAFFYNVIGIPVAAGMFASIGLVLNPMIGAAAMSLSSFCVVSNALRLNMFDIRKNKNTKRVSGKRKERIMQKVIKIEGMMCLHCEARIKKLLEEIPQVQEAQVSHTTKTATVVVKDEVADEVFIREIEAQGYKVISIE